MDEILVRLCSLGSPDSTHTDHEDFIGTDPSVTVIDNTHTTANHNIQSTQASSPRN
jgi:hypothetical protein